MITVSLCIVVHNNEAIIERCLNSVIGIVDEIIVVDLDSSDRTVGLVKNFSERVFSLEENTNKEDALSYSITKATKDFILFLNPSEVLQENDRKKFVQLKQEMNKDAIHFTLDYQLGWNETSKRKVTRLVNRLHTRNVNETLNKEDTLETLLSIDLTITDLPFTENIEDNLSMFDQMLNHNLNFSPRDLFYYARELCSNTQFEKAIKYFLNYLRTNQQFEEHNILACNYLANCYHELNFKELETIWLLKALQYGKTHPETCCRLGYLYLEKMNLDSAIYWYKEAILNKVNTRLLDHNPSCSTWLPHLQLAVCYDKIGEYELANEHNEKALQFSPAHPIILSNREYFSYRLNSKGS
ncbi:glycosyltransferase [Gottfriedia luciferensis]|uniref:glycosyltransferase n=1 Tax=Gottfriedia luciferensis TaxID=178774 RepID=UPI000B44D5A0|nr:glycosyltransferase [Gottfriedia luciferensis]